MAGNNGKKHIISALMRRHSDRVPVTVLIGPYCSRLTNYSIKEILRDAQKSTEAHLAFYERFSPDSVIVYNDIYLEAEALGCELDFPEDDISHPKTVLLENKSRLARLKIPDPNKDGRLPYFIEVCQRVSAQVRKTAALGLGHSGPWNIAMHLRGTEALLLDTYSDPVFVHDLMKFSTEVVRSVGDALIEAGFSPSIGEAGASCSLISPQIYREFIKPYHTELCSYFRSKGAYLALHICGEIDLIMKDVVETGINFLSLDAPSSLKRFVQIGNGKVAGMGNIPTTLFSSGTPLEMEKAIVDCIETAAAQSGYILASGCEIPLNSTEDRISHFFNYSRHYGRQFVSDLKSRRPE
ncbi:MAG: uroporphyrinogen decarboxylase family protein [Desulfobacterales bacterium]|jgi:uroporphyrinogen decarboxylase